MNGPTRTRSSRRPAVPPLRDGIRVAAGRIRGFDAREQLLQPHAIGRRSCFVGATSISRSPTSDLLSAESRAPRARFRPSASAGVTVRGAPAADDGQPSRVSRRRSRKSREARLWRLAFPRELEGLRRTSPPGREPGRGGPNARPCAGSQALQRLAPARAGVPLIPAHAGGDRPMTRANGESRRREPPSGPRRASPGAARSSSTSRSWRRAWARPRPPDTRVPRARAAFSHAFSQIVIHGRPVKPALDAAARRVQRDLADHQYNESTER